MLTAVHVGDVIEQLERSIDDVVPSPSPPLEPMYQIVMDTQSPLVSREVAGPTSANPDVTHSSLTKLSLATIHAVIIGVGIVVVDITERKRRISGPDRQEQSLRT